jgi:hypothetical protein
MSPIGGPRFSVTTSAWTVSSIAAVHCTNQDLTPCCSGAVPNMTSESDTQLTGAAIGRGISSRHILTWDCRTFSGAEAVNSIETGPPVAK